MAAATPLASAPATAEGQEAEDEPAEKPASE